MRIFLAFVFLCLFGLFLPRGLFAASVSDAIAISVSVADPNAQDGDIISSKPDGFVLTNIPYDPLMYAVIAQTPVAVLENTTLENRRSVITAGNVFVRVSAKNGNITKGDFITSSDSPGVGQKADKSGYILGAALEPFQTNNPEEIRRIPVAVNIHFVSSISGRENLVEIIKTGISAPLFSPLGTLRYLLAVVIVVAAFVLAFLSFGRTAQSGVEALGRNPLASRVIEFNIVLNVIVTLVILLTGLLLAYFVLTL